MATSKNVNDIILNLIEYLRTSQPDLDVKPGAVARDLFVDAPSIQLAALYDELQLVSSKQGIANVILGDLDKYVANYGITRKQASPSTGTALLTFSSINIPIAINKGDLISAKSGATFQVTSSLSISPAATNFYKSIASKYKNDLDFLNIKDLYAVEIPVQATSPGVGGNISKYVLKSTSIQGVSNVTNVSAFTNGQPTEDDVSLKNRFLASLRGSSVGTSLGYKSAAIATSGVSDALIIGPGDPLMQRDGTVAVLNSDGTYSILSEGSGGKVDVIILGSSLIQNTDSFIYIDKSNTGNAFDPKNNYVLGQIPGDENKSITKRRIDNITNGILPAQPVDSVIEVTGSSSGSNFKPKTTDIYGRTFGNYEIIKDTGFYSGSPFGFDSFAFISNEISDFQEDKIKGAFNSQDQTSFSDVSNISNIQQLVLISNENSSITSDKSVIQLLHTPAQNVTRVFNVTTGERYVVINQNPNGTGLLNTSGLVKISGNNLPSPTDILQVDYSWIVSYDKHSDFDGLKQTNNSRIVGDSVDWGYSNLIQKELCVLTKDNVNSYYSTNLSFPISSIVSVKMFESLDGYVETMTSGVYVTRKYIKLNLLSEKVNSVFGVKSKNSYKELKTNDNDLTIINEPTVVSSQLRYNVYIILPTDTTALNNEKYSVLFNELDVSLNHSISGNLLTIPTTNISTSYSQYDVYVDYIANLNLMDSLNADSFPLIKFGNSYIKKSSIDVDSKLSSPKKFFGKVALNSFSQFIVDLDLSVLDYKITKEDIYSVIRLSDGAELFDGYLGSVLNTNNYQVVVTSNSPVVNDDVIVLFNKKEITKFQPFSYQQNVLSQSFDVIKNDGSNYYVYAKTITNDNSFIGFIKDETNSNSYVSFVDGYTVTDTTNTFFCYTNANFSSILDLTNKKLQISDASFSNNGIFDIVAYDSVLKRLTCKFETSQIQEKQISVTRLSDGKEIGFDASVVNNKIILSGSYNLSDKVFVNITNLNPLRKSPTKITCTLSDQNNIQGSLLFKGTTLIKFEDIVYTSVLTGLKQDITDVIRRVLKLTSNDSIPSNVFLANVIKCEKVTTTTISSDDVISTLNVYGTNGISIKDNSIYLDNYSDSSLTPYQFKLIDSSINSNQPQIGDRIRVSGYIAISNDSEQINCSKSGTNYTNKKFAKIDSIASLGGISLSTTKVILTSFNQPTVGSRYKVTYDYLAPKPNERITISYNYNKAIGDVTLALEAVRPINDDVIVKQAKAIPVDITMNIVVASNSLSSSNIVVQNVQDAINTFVNQKVLNPTIDASDAVNEAYNVAGVDRARVIYFNKSGESGQKLSLVAQKNEYFVANNILVNVETR